MNIKSKYKVMKLTKLLNFCKRNSGHCLLAFQFDSQQVVSSLLLLRIIGFSIFLFTLFFDFSITVPKS